MQRHDIETYCNARGWSVTREYSDLGISGSKSSRPGLDELMREVRRRKVKTIIIWSLSRLGRSLRHLLTIVEEFQACGVTLVSLKEGWDLSTPSGRMIFQVLGALSEWEREQIRERVRSGLKAAKAKGKRLGRPGINIDLEEAYKLRAEGKSLRAIAQELGVSKSTLARTLAIRASKAA